MLTEEFRNSPNLAILWFLVLAVIPVISYFGRSLQFFLEGRIGYVGIAWVMGIVTGVLLLFAGLLLVRKSGFSGVLHLLWAAVLAALLMYYLRRHPERWYHIPLFGLLGFLSASLFSVRTAAEITLGWAVLDELFQHYLPDRVGDFEDVMINAISGSAGLILYLILSKRVGKGRDR